MDLLATLPAIVGLVAKSQILTNINDNGDWVQFLSECMNNIYEGIDSRKASMANFLRLYITLNA